MSQNIQNKWNSWISKFENSVGELLENRKFFREFLNIIKSNSNLPENNHFLIWIWTNYIISALMGIRRLIDSHHKCISLINLLGEIKRSPYILSRIRFASLFNNTALSDDDDYINQCFDELVGENKEHIDPRDVQKDIQLLNKKYKRLKYYIDKRIAHTDKDKITKLPKIKDLDDCINYLEELVIKYSAIFHANQIDGLEPRLQYRWKNIFRIPWVAE